jgi:predicted TIM-barrel fold metal-dependent hydrolase
MISLCKGWLLAKKVNKILAELWDRYPDSFIKLRNPDTRSQRNEIGRIVLKGEVMKVKIIRVPVQLNRHQLELRWKFFKITDFAPKDPGQKAPHEPSLENSPPLT